MTVEVHDGSIRVRDGFTFLRRGALAAVVAFLGLAGMSFAAGPPASAASAVVGAIACAALAAVLEDSDFVFDAGAREVRWTKRAIGRARGGTIAFADVENVVLDVRSDRDDARSAATVDYRVLLVTRAGTLPLGQSNLDLAAARDGVALPVLRLLAKSGAHLTGDAPRQPSAERARGPR